MTNPVRQRACLPAGGRGEMKATRNAEVLREAFMKPQPLGGWYSTGHRVLRHALSSGTIMYMFELHHKGTSLVSDAMLLPNLHRLSPYRGHLERVLTKGAYESPESCLGLPHDTDNIAAVRHVAAQMGTSHLRYVIVVGIGASSLGTKAVYDAIWGRYDTFEPMRFPKALFLETIEPEILAKLCKLVEDEVENEKELAIVIVSKSGGTFETSVNAERLLSMLRKKWAAIDSRVIAVSVEDSPLWKRSWERGWHSMAMPATVSGRYSFFSAVGLLPLILLGVAIDDLVDGAREASRHCWKDTIEDNLPAVCAATQYALAKKGVTSSELMIFSPALESLGKWWRQLTAESLGKDGKGILPIVSIGTNDFHSIVQYDLDGPGGMLTTFMYPQEPDIENENASHMASILKVVEIAYRVQKRPFMTLVTPPVSLQMIGFFMQTKMIETMFLAHLMEVDAFNQPAVELFKREIRTSSGI